MASLWVVMITDFTYRFQLLLRFNISCISMDVMIVICSNILAFFNNHIGDIFCL